MWCGIILYVDVFFWLFNNRQKISLHVSFNNDFLFADSWRLVNYRASKVNKKQEQKKCIYSFSTRLIVQYFPPKFVSLVNEMYG